MDKHLSQCTDDISIDLQHRTRRSRSLSSHEVAMAKQLFGDTLDYGRVRIHGRRYLPFQPRNCCMTPNGSMYFHRSCFLPDYTRGEAPVIHWFMHEMVNLWRFAHHLLVQKSHSKVARIGRVIYPSCCR